MRLIPDSSATISARLQDGTPPVWSLRGPLLTPELRCFEASTTLVGIRLRPGVAFLLTGISTDTLAHKRIELTALAGFQDLVADCSPRTPLEYIAVLERFLIARLERARIHPVVSAALGALERERGSIAAADLAARVGVSPRHLNRLMRRWVGYGTKRLATIVRFQATLHDMEPPARRPAASLAIDNGYFDQSHLTHDAVRLAGTTPGRLASHAASDFSKTRCDDLL
jgi:AraC-like DNA-binding protein